MLPRQEHVHTAEPGCCPIRDNRTSRYDEAQRPRAQAERVADLRGNVHTSHDPA